MRKQEKNSPPPDHADHLPARSRQNTALLQVSHRGIKIVVEQGAQVYFSTCRRLARLLNRRR